jgi:hypothetical protein
VGIGAGLAWNAIGFLRTLNLRRMLHSTASVAFVTALLWQSLVWTHDYLELYPMAVSSAYQDGLLETMRRTTKYAPAFDEIWIDTDGMVEPHIYLLAARPMAPEQTQALIQVTRRPLRFNVTTSIGPYHFGTPPEQGSTITVLDAVPDQYGGPGYVIQEWHGSKRLLVVRRMKL